MSDVFDRASELRATIRDLTKQLKETEAELSIIYRNCSHDWSRPYIIWVKETPSDSTQRVDTDYEWERVCSLCGLSERTFLE